MKKQTGLSGKLRKEQRFFFDYLIKMIFRFTGLIYLIENYCLKKILFNKFFH